mgnify:CR=1 FL=1
MLAYMFDGHIIETRGAAHYEITGVLYTFKMNSKCRLTLCSLSQQLSSERSLRVALRVHRGKLLTNHEW